MSDTIIKVEGLGKKYIISHEKPENYTALRDVIARKTKGLIKKVGVQLPSKEDFWALKNVSFEVQRGEALGIIGRNGAGKSTLLKILSRITEPTTGRIEINGRVASLLEVGTGFHQELTGRENIFLNGAILGMSRLEVRKKFDEIVDFAGVEKFLDTPVKRYSSGMYVRLAFAVAAHLEPEVLVVDEVLAVGDAEFQKKCLGKMKEESEGQGRTVLFVSHNIATIRSLCGKGILLNNGQIEIAGEIDLVTDKYLQSNDDEKCKKWSIEDQYGSEKAQLLEVEITSTEQILFIENPLEIRFRAHINPHPKKKSREINFSMVLLSAENIPIMNVVSSVKTISDEFIEASCCIPANFLNDEYYSVKILLVEDMTLPLFDLNDVIGFKMVEREREGHWHGKWVGVIRPIELIKWNFK
jgi:lipopolysaccharide transport system ATP-binding protein